MQKKRIRETMNIDDIITESIDNFLLQEDFGGLFKNIRRKGRRLVNQTKNNRGNFDDEIDVDGDSEERNTSERSVVIGGGSEKDMKRGGGKRKRNKVKNAQKTDNTRPMPHGRNKRKRNKVKKVNPTPVPQVTPQNTDPRQTRQRSTSNTPVNASNYVDLNDDYPISNAIYKLAQEGKIRNTSNVFRVIQQLEKIGW